MTITEKALADLLLKYFTTLEAVGKDVTLKNEMKKVAQPDGSTKVQMVPKKGDAFLPKDISNSMAKAIAKAIHPNLTITGANAFDWNYFNSVLPAGISAGNLLSLFQFDGTGDNYTDRSGNGFELESWVGSEMHTVIPVSSSKGYLVGEAFNENHGLRFIPGTGGNDAHRILGDLTGEVLLVYEGNTGTADCLFDFRYTSDTDASSIYNVLYTVQITANQGQFNCFHEYGTGVNYSWTPPTYVYPGLIQHVIYTREAGGAARFYQNGYKVGETTITNMPTGGSSSSFSMGRTRANTNPLNGCILSARFFDKPFTDAQALESYRRVRGIIT